MSTKTSIKRIALVAVSALGFGLLSVMPANATEVTAVVVTAADDTLSTTVGSAITTVINTTAVTATTEASGITWTPTVTKKPAGSTLDIGAPGAAKAGLTTTGYATPFNAAEATADKWTTTATAGVISSVWSSGTIPTVTTATAVGTLSITPDVPGVYQITVTPTLTNNAGDAGATKTAEIVYVIATAPSGTAASTATASLTANWNGSTFRAGQGVANTGTTTDPALTIGYPAGATVVADSIKFKVLTSADADLPVNTVIDATYGSGANNAAGLVTESTNGSGATSAVFTFNTYGTTLLNSTGLYEFLVFEDSNLDGNYNSGERFVTTSMTLAGTPTTYAIGLSASTAAQGDVLLMDVTFSDALGRRTAINSEAITITLPTGVTSAGDSSIDRTDAIGTAGTYREVLTVGAATAGTNTISGTGTVNGATVAKTAPFTMRVPGNNATEFSYVAAAGIAPGAASDVTLEAGDLAGAISVDLANPTVYFKVAAPAAATVTVTTTSAVVTLGSSRISTAGTRYYTSQTDGSVTFPVTVTSPVAGDSYTITLDAAADMTYTVTYADPGAAWTISPAPSVNLVKGGSLKYTTTLKDVFGRPLASKAVSASVSGRNTATFSGITTAAGVFEFTVTDTDTRACCSTTTDVITDTITLTYNYSEVDGDAATATGGTATITYVATAVAAGDIAITPSATTATIDQLERVAGEPANLITYTATVRTSVGANVAAGTLCTWTADADTLFYAGSTSATSSGQCTIRVYRQKAGYSAVTVSAGGKTASNGVVLWSNTTTDARNIAIAAAPASIVSAGTSTITATVTDRWGNPVSGVAVTFAEIGAGRISATAAVNTNVNGVASTDFTSNAGETGTSTVSASITGTSQTSDLAGFVTVTGGTTVAVPGVTAGNRSTSTVVTITKDTSVSTADALLELAKAIGTGNSANAAADAALEAIDAANAATDAANLAAEAADAATVAAEEARDAADAATAAVEALASEVATLVAALKAQITTLANTVAKIAKRVKA